jgi:hypothetical protein
MPLGIALVEAAEKPASHWKPGPAGRLDRHRWAPDEKDPET